MMLVLQTPPLTPTRTPTTLAGSVLKDKDILIQDPNFVTEYPPDPETPYSRTNGLIRSFKININLKVPIKVQFNAVNGGTVLDIVDNSFHVLCACTGVSTNNPPSISYTRVLLTRSNYDNKTTKTKTS